MASSLYAFESRFYHANLSYEQGKLGLKGVKVFQGYIPHEPQKGDYRVELISLSGNTLYSDRFQIPLAIHGEQIDVKTGESVPTSLNVENIDISLSIPYSSEGQVINIYDFRNTKILDIPVIGFAQVTPTPSKPPQTSVLDQPSAKIILALVIIGLVVLVIVFLFRKFKKNRMETNQEITEDVNRA